MEIKIVPNKTYASRANAVKAVEKFPAFIEARYFITCGDDGRFFPIFVGEKAVQLGVHFHFNVVG